MKDWEKELKEGKEEVKERGKQIKQLQEDSKIRDL